MVITDVFSILYIYKVMKALLSSPMYYFLTLLLTGLFIIFDIMYLIILRETQPSLSQMFVSLEKKREKGDQTAARRSLFDKVVGPVKDTLFGYDTAM